MRQERNRYLILFIQGLQILFILLIRLIWNPLQQPIFQFASVLIMLYQTVITPTKLKGYPLFILQSPLACQTLPQVTYIKQLHLPKYLIMIINFEINQQWILYHHLSFIHELNILIALLKLIQDRFLGYHLCTFVQWHYSDYYFPFIFSYFIWLIFLQLFLYPFEFFFILLLFQILL